MGRRERGRELKTDLDVKNQPGELNCPLFLILSCKNTGSNPSALMQFISLPLMLFCGRPVGVNERCNAPEQEELLVFDWC